MTKSAHRLDREMRKALKPDKSFKHHAWKAVDEDSEKVFTCGGCGMFGLPPLNLQTYGWCSGDPDMPLAP